MPAVRPAPAAAPDAIDRTPLSDSLRALARRGVVRSYRKGSLLIQEGDLGDTLYIILAGRLRAFSTSADGQREVTYGHYGPGEYVGEMGLDGDPRAATVLAMEPTTCAVVTRATLLAHIAEQPEFALELVSKLIRRARAATLSVKQMALNDVYGRLKALLETQCGIDTPHAARAWEDRPTHQEISQQLGCSREMVSRLLKDLETGGYVQVERRRIVLARPLPVRW